MLLNFVPPESIIIFRVLIDTTLLHGRAHYYSYLLYSLSFFFSVIRWVGPELIGGPIKDDRYTFMCGWTLDHSP